MAERRRLTLREWEPAEVDLSPAEAAILRDGPGVIRVDGLGPGRYKVTPSHHVGSLALPETDVLIVPKVSIPRLFFLLGYAKRMRFREDAVALDPSRDITETIVHAFLEQTRVALRRRPLHAYRSVDEALTTVRGRVRVVDQARRHFAMPLPIEATYDEFTADIAENRLVKAALRRTERIRFRDASLRPRIRENLAVLEAVSDVPFDRRTSYAVPITRLNRHYELAMGLARVILASTSADLVHGSVRVPSFLVDMDKVFEDFVFRAVGDALRLRRGAWKQGRSTALDVAGRVTIKPDLSIWIGKRCVFVGDVKYKVTDLGANDDLYQVLAYARATGQQEALLLYASASRGVDRHVVRNDGTAIEVRYVDLESQDGAILAEVRRTARAIERMAAAADRLGSGDRPARALVTR